MKPIGATGNYIKLTEKFSNATHELYFAKFPRGIKYGDILIAYAVGFKKVLSIFKATSKVNKTTDPNHRWHYFIYGENLTRLYGNEWNNYNIHISDQKKIFINETKLNATPSGRNSYGTLQRGGDKLRITNDFGHYLLNKIVVINKDIAFNHENI